MVGGSDNNGGVPEQVLVPGTRPGEQVLVSDTRQGERLTGFTGRNFPDLSKVDVDGLHDVVLGEIDRRKSIQDQGR
ncbi:Uncharacterised protein [Mycobacteroides abscessus subsp. abscessus]|uniref:hypothetical protein n=1 Tax=Mycobacteroides abscessus TaxID=36809 RepID=UPI000926DB86|nr:hypothetical protein [Mycobacteroides abscessus]SHY08330.1 Uncharacterised protein [Mycobacteroides abscessus subsp. abscessus]SIC76131.1 Uncharacterised protein [Mycobacteroides abscessus subsp. abscessus]SKP28430.1 Uncharacterised protein [Mycobacteroides abscessus subsp. abscessus]